MQKDTLKCAVVGQDAQPRCSAKVLSQGARPRVEKAVYRIQAPGLVPLRLPRSQAHVCKVPHWWAHTGPGLGRRYRDTQPHWTHFPTPRRGQRACPPSWPASMSERTAVAKAQQGSDKFLFPCLPNKTSKSQTVKKVIKQNGTVCAPFHLRVVGKKPSRAHRGQRSAMPSRDQGEEGSAQRPRGQTL